MWLIYTFFLVKSLKIVKRLIHKIRGQRPNESQKAVIIDMMKSVGEIASKIWPAVQHLTRFGENLTLTLEVKVIGTWVIECALLGCTLVPSMKSVGEIASEMWPIL